MFIATIVRRMLERQLTLETWEVYGKQRLFVITHDWNNTNVSSARMCTDYRGFRRSLVIASIGVIWHNVVGRWEGWNSSESICFYSDIQMGKETDENPHGSCLYIYRQSVVFQTILPKLVSLLPDWMRWEPTNSGRDRVFNERHALGDRNRAWCG